MHTPQHAMQQINECRQIVQQLIQQTQQGTQLYKQMLQQEQHNVQVIQQSLQGHNQALQQCQQILNVCNQMQQEISVGAYSSTPAYMQNEQLHTQNQVQSQLPSYRHFQQQNRQFIQQ